jgi:hypothetical protein
MPSTVQIPAVLSLTLDAVRDRLHDQVGTRGVPSLWWSLSDPETNDCLGFLLWGLGVRDRDDFDERVVRISRFRAVSSWQGLDPEEIRPGDLVYWAWNADDDDLADHAEFCYSIDRHAGTITTLSANTGPRVGDDIDAHPELRCVAKKTRPLRPTPGARIVGGSRPPYRSAATVATSGDRKTVRIEASYLNASVPGTFEGRTLLRSAAGTIRGHVPHGDGIRGPLFWMLVQVWGRLHGLYGKAYKIDGIPGPQSRRVEAEILRHAKAAGYAKAA